MGDAKRNTEAVSEFVERFASELAEAGMPRMPSRVFSCLMAHDRGVLTSAQLSERLQVSPAAVSGAVGYLVRVGLVSREREPGSRRDRYRVRDNAWFESMAQRDETMLRWIRVLKEGVDAVGGDSAAGRRLSESGEFFAFMMAELSGVLDRWRARQGIGPTGTP